MRSRLSTPSECSMTARHSFSYYFYETREGLCMCTFGLRQEPEFLVGKFYLFLLDRLAVSIRYEGRVVWKSVRVGGFIRS